MNAKEYLSKLNDLKAQTYQILSAQLKELGATPDKPIEFDWENQDAPSVIAICFGGDVTETYVKSIYIDGESIYVSLYSHYEDDNVDNVLLTESCMDYDDIIYCLIDWSWE